MTRITSETRVDRNLERVLLPDVRARLDSAVVTITVRDCHNLVVNRAEVGYPNGAPGGSEGCVLLGFMISAWERPLQVDPNGPGRRPYAQCGCGLGNVGLSR
jgi:hypothetical protein